MTDTKLLKDGADVSVPDGNPVSPPKDGGTGFEPITTQVEFDERIKARLAREREKWERQSGVEDLQREIADLKRETYLAEVRRAVVADLASRGVTDDGRIQRILKHVELEAIKPDENGQPDRLEIQDQLAAVGKDMPELLTYRVGAGSHGSQRPVLQEKQEPPLTREEVENMSEEEINSSWSRVQAFLRGERS